MKICTNNSLALKDWALTCFPFIVHPGIFFFCFKDEVLISSNAAVVWTQQDCNTAASLPDSISEKIELNNNNMQPMGTGVYDHDTENSG